VEGTVFRSRELGCDAAELGPRKSLRLAQAGVLVALALAVGLVATADARAASGDLDPSFGQGGEVRTTFSPGKASAESVAIDAKGRIVAAGASCPTLGRCDFALARYKTNGNLDPSFGSGGMVTTAFAGGPAVAGAVAIDSTGRIIAGGVIVGATSALPSRFALAAYKPNGTLDPTFGDGGKVDTGLFPYTGRFPSITIDSNDRILAAGFASRNGQHDVLARFNPDGSLDPSFGSHGMVYTYAGNYRSVATYPGDRVVAAGHKIVRLRSDGSFDPSFGGDGKRTSPGLTASSAAIDSKGRIVVAGYVLRDEHEQLVTRRFAQDGARDRSFSKDGVAKVPLARGPLPSVAIDSKGRIVVAEGYRPITVVRYRPSGKRDRSFGDRGVVRKPRDAGKRSVATDARDRIIVASHLFGAGGGFGLVRYLG
jgi:uncharacterized delta-60 repeat protein